MLVERNRFRVLHYLSFLFICFSVYGITLSYQFVYDDPYFYINNSHLMNSSVIDFFQDDYWSFSTYPTLTSTGVYRPLALLFIYTNLKIFGADPAIHHLINIFLHFLCVCLVFHLLNRIFLIHRNLSFFSAVIFALHPIHVEAIAWVISFQHILVTILILLALTFYFASQEQNRFSYLILSFAMYTLSLFTLEIALAFPIVIFLFDWLRYRKFFFLNQLVFISISLGYLFVRRLALGEFVPLSMENNQYFVNYFFGYIKNLVLPVPQGIYFDAPFFGLFEYLFVIFLLIVFSLYLLINWHNPEIRQNIIFSVGWIFLFLSPVLVATFNSKTYFSPRVLYLPSVGFIFLFAVMIMQLRSNVCRKAIFTLIIIMFAGLSLSHVQAWESNQTLYSKVFSVSKDSVFAASAYGNLLLESGKYEEAINVLRVGLSNAKEAKEKTDFYNFLGQAYARNGQLKQSSEYFQQSLTSQPDNINALLGLGNIAMMGGSLDQAENYYLLTLQQEKTNYEALMNLATIFKIRGDLNRGNYYFNLALKNQKNNR